MIFHAPLVLFSTIDPALGRLDPLLLSDQSCLEIAFEGTKRNILKDEDGNTIDFVDCQEHYEEDFDDEGRIIVLCHQAASGEAEEIGLGGSVNFAFLPRQLRKIMLRNNLLEQTLDTRHLPNTLEVFYIADNFFHGEFCTKDLPQTLERLSISVNKFAGSLDLEHLPPRLIAFAASRNQFSGKVSLATLPRCLETLDISFNKLAGELLPEAIPQALKYFLAAHNQFSNNVEERAFPDTNLFPDFD